MQQVTYKKNCMELDDLVTRFSSVKENQRKAIMLMFHKKQKPDRNKRIGEKNNV